MRIGRIYRTRLDERDGDGRTVFFQLHTQRVRKAFHGMLRGAVDSLNGDRAVREGAADVDEPTATLLEMLCGNVRAVDYAPEVCIEEAALILYRNLHHLAVDRDARVIVPSV